MSPDCAPSAFHDRHDPPLGATAPCVLTSWPAARARFGQHAPVYRLVVQLGRCGVARSRGHWRTGRFGAAVLMVSMAGTLAACGDSAPAVGLSGPGTPLAEGLVVPPGTHMIGPVFPSPGDVGGDKRGFVALLAVDGDPFAAWDDLARQTRDLGAPLASSGSCAWYDIRTEQGGLLEPEFVDQPRPDTAEAMACGGSGYGPKQGGGSLCVNAEMWWWAQGAELGLEVSTGEDECGSTDSDRGPAPSSAVAELPSRDVPRRGIDPVRLSLVPVMPDVGEPFGLETNCFEQGYARLRVPPGARLVGGGTAPVLGSFAAVLAVSDPKAVLEHIADQLDPTGPDAGEGSVTIETVNLPEGPVWVLTGDVSAGGGSCQMWSSPDGRAVLVTTWND